MFDVLNSIENTIAPIVIQLLFLQRTNNQTAGYKKLEWSFQTMLTKEMSHLGMSSGTGISKQIHQTIPSGVRIVPGG